MLSVVCIHYSNIFTFTIKTNTLSQMFGLVAFIEQKENDNNENLCKIHGDLYIASALKSMVVVTLLSFSFCSIKATRPKICKKSVCFNCIITSLWRTPVNYLPLIFDFQKHVLPVSVRWCAATILVKFHIVIYTPISIQCAGDFIIHILCFVCRICKLV